jgi:serine/threonine-protein kinase
VPLELGAGSTAPNQLPFNGSTDSVDVAVDSAGSIYVSGDHRVWKLAAGSRSQVELPFGNMRNPTGVAVDDEVHHPERRLDDRGRSSWVRR